MSWLQRLFGGDRQAERPDGVPRVPESGDAAADAARPPVAAGEVVVWIDGGWAVMPAAERTHTMVVDGCVYHHTSDDDGAWVYARLR